MHCSAPVMGEEALVRQMSEQAVAMVEGLAALVSQGKPTLAELEQAVLGRLKEVGNGLLGELCQHRAPRYPAGHVACPCGGEAVYQRQRTGQCKTLLGTIQLTRAYYLCPQCHQGFCPLDQQLGFCAGSISAGLDELLALLGVQYSFAHSAALVARLTLVQVSAGRCRKSTEALGRQVVAAEEEQRQQVWEQPAPYVSPVCPTPLDPLYVSADGVTVHTRESGWREQCVGAIYTAHPQRGHLRSRQATYVTDLGSRTRFSQQLWLEAQRRGLAQAKQVVFIGDGAQWLWETAHDLFPQALQILDWYHASTYVWAVAHECHPKDSAAAQQWAEEHLALLRHSQTDALLTKLESLAQTLPAARTAWTYLTNNRNRLDYVRYRQLGLQIGSGTIESTCNHLIGARLKQSGMRWTLANARAVAKLRARLKSDRWLETLTLRKPPHRPYHRQTLPT